MNHHHGIVGLLLLVLAPTTMSADETQEPQLTLPQHLYAVVGQPYAIYFDNTVLSPASGDYHFEVTGTLGAADARRWQVTPTTDDAGSHQLAVTVRDPSGKQLASAETQLHIARADAAANRTIRLMLVGDSLTHATHYPNSLAELLNGPHNPRWSMLGTHRPGNAADGVAHEGYGGWTWQRFLAHYEPNPDGTHRKRSSPFVFLDENNTPQLNLQEYFNTTADGQPPDLVFFVLGINDCFGAKLDSVDTIDQRISTMLSHADQLIAAFRQTCPETDLAICVTTPPNARDAAFEANYKGRYTRQGWKRIQHRLVQRLLTHFNPQSEEDRQRLHRVHLVPTQLNLDPVDGYPPNNGVHPNPAGYRQVAVSLYAWLKWHLQQSE